MEHDIAIFQKTVWAYYATHGRDLPWRHANADGEFDPYAIMVSELMLQQTQVARVIPKFVAFMDRFPGVDQLAAAPLADVLTAWSGLGYNRRAKFLQQAAQRIVAQGGDFPCDQVGLTALPGIGVNTAGAILAYAFNQPVVFIETNVRTVFIHHFFADQADVSDKAIHELVARTLDQTDPRQWYWALMDYGSHLKQTVGNLSRQSKSYVRQSRFEGSRRQIRGAILRQLTAGPVPEEKLAISDDRLSAVVAELIQEGLVSRQADKLQLAL